MKNVRVEASIDATVNIGDFQNVKPGFKISADVEEEEKVFEVKDKLVNTISSWLETEVQKIRDELK
jgi:hypothetical protein